MSDNQYFMKLWNVEATKSNNILTLYSDRVSKITDLFFPNGGYRPDYNSSPYDLEKVLVEYELSPHYIVGTTSYVNEVSRIVYRGDFQFSGKELVSGTVSEVIQVGGNGEIRGYRLASPVKVIPSSAEQGGLPSTSELEYDKSRYDAGFNSEYGASTEITTIQGYEQFFSAGWANRPFEDNLVSVGKTSSGSGSSSGGSTSTSVQPEINTMTSITPSTRQLNEGDSLSTTLSGFTPNSTQFFSVTGRGINKKDFSAGAVKGSVRVDSNGVATISHTLRADKATEGEESFSVQVFSDKRMRNSLGQSDAVTVFDTSVKAPKVVKPPKGGGGVKEPTIPKGKETGRFIEFEDGIKLFSGQTYTHDSITGQKLLKFGQNALATYCPGESCTDNNDVRLANKDVDPVTGYRSLDALPQGATYQWNLQFNETYLSLTGQYTNGDIKTTGRVVFKGTNTFKEDRLFSFRPTIVADVYVNGHNPTLAYSGGVNKINSSRVASPFTFRESDKSDNYDYGDSISNYGDRAFSSASQMTAHLNFENGKFFYNGWDANISANLL